MIENQPETTSGIPLKLLYRSADVPPGIREALAQPPGRAPYLRGAYPRMYRDRPWRIFQLSGYGNPEDMNKRLKFLLFEAGETGIIIKHDRMTDDHLYDVDHPEIVERREDVGLTGTVTVGLRDYETILSGLPLESIYAKPGGGVPQSAVYTLPSYWSVASRRGIPLEKLAGTGQSDFFLTYLGCPTKEQIPPEAAIRFNLDLIEWCSERMPRWVPVSIAGYNAADSGLSAPQELGAVMANAAQYLDLIAARGRVDLESLVHRIGGVNFRVSMEIFEDAAKLRAARKMWSDMLADRYGITNEKARQMRIHVVTAGSAMTYQEPFNNIVRGTLMALASVLGGTQSLGVSGYDEAMSIPSDHAHLMSIRIQQILQNEINLREVADPLGGSFYIESLTGELEERGWEFFDQIQSRGGFLAVLDDGFLLECAEENNQRIAAGMESGDRAVVGVNTHTIDDPILEVEAFEGRSGAQTWEMAMERLDDLRRTRHRQGAMEALRQLEAVCRDDSVNAIPAFMEAVSADASIGEIGNVLRETFGDWQAPISV